MLFNSLIEETGKMLQLIQRIIQTTDTFINQEYWKKFASRCKTGFLGLGEELSLYVTEFIGMCINKSYVHCFQFPIN